MPQTPARIAGPAALGTSAATIYTAPAGIGIVVRRIHVANTSASSASLTLSIGADAAGKRLYDGYAIAAHAELDRVVYFALDPGEVIQAFASAGSALSLEIDGIEYALVGPRGFALLADNFDQAFLDGSKWQESALGGSASTSYDGSGGHLVYPALCSAATNGNVESTHTYDLTESRAHAKVPTWPSALTAADADFRLSDAQGNSLQQVLTFSVESGGMEAAYRVAGVKTILDSFTYSAATHVWFRWREHAGTIFWETSADGLAWTAHGSAPTPFDISALYAVFHISCYQAEISPGEFVFNHFNT